MNISYSTKRNSGQIPAFGNWDYENELPITQYFESARQAGLLRNTSSSGECDLYRVPDFKMQLSPPAVPPLKTATRRRVTREKRSTHVKDQKKQQVGKVVCDVTEPSTRTTCNNNKKQVVWLHHNDRDRDAGPAPKLTGITVVGAPKPVDEDLYKISPDLLHYHSRRKKMLGLFPRCLLPPCVV